MFGEYVRASDQVDLGALIEAAPYCAARAGLLVARNISSAISVLKQVDPLLSGLGSDGETVSITRAVDSSPLLKELILFGMSSDYFSLRRKMRLGLVAE